MPEQQRLSSWGWPYRNSPQSQGKRPVDLTFRRRTGGFSVFALALIVAVSPLARARAQESAPDSQQQQKIDQLTQQLDQMKHQQDDLVKQLKALQDQINVKIPVAAAGAASPPAPSTIGEHVAQIEHDISTNLGVSIHGLVDASYEANFNDPQATGSKGGGPNSPGANQNQLRAWDISTGFQFTQGNIHIEKDGTVGFVTDINFGQVANSVSSVTHYSNLNGSGPGGQWIDPTQYYLTYTLPLGSGISLQAGRFVTLLGAEIIPTYTNQNYNETRGLLFNLGEPLTHTGIRGSYTFNDYVAFTGGVNNGWDNPGQLGNNGPNYEGELGLNNKDKSIALSLNGIWGPNLSAFSPQAGATVGKSNSNLGAVDPIVTLKPAFLPNTTFQTEYLWASESGPVVNGHSATWQGVAQYLVYDWKEWEFATRGEWFDDEDGARTTTVNDGVPNGSPARQTLWEVTQTLTYKVPEVTGLLARLEYRHDNSSKHYFTNNNAITNNATTNFNPEQQLWRGQDTLTGALIYAF
jgi:Putative beta-barrel porin-2, OmpL-like. bbp2